MAARKEFTLAERVQVIEYVKNNPGIGSCAIAEMFHCGRTQIQKILRQKEAILSDYAMNAPPLLLGNVVDCQRMLILMMLCMNGIALQGSEIFLYLGLC